MMERIWFKRIMNVKKDIVKGIGNRNRRRNRVKLFFLCLLMLVLVPLASTQADTSKNLVNIYFFHSDTCFHCESESKVLDALEKRYDNVVIYRYEIHTNENAEIRKRVQELYDIKTNGVPLTVIGDTYYIGFKEETSKIEFIKTIEYYSRYDYVDKVGRYCVMKRHLYLRWMKLF